MFAVIALDKLSLGAYILKASWLTLRVGFLFELSCSDISATNPSCQVWCTTAMFTSMTLSKYQGLEAHVASAFEIHHVCRRANFANVVAAQQHSQLAHYYGGDN